MAELLIALIMVKYPSRIMLVDSDEPVASAATNMAEPSTNARILELLLEMQIAVASADNLIVATSLIALISAMFWD